MSVIVVGDNGTELVVRIKDDEGIVDLTTASSITARFLRADKTRFEKSLTVTDAQAGKCSTILTSDDLLSSGTYKFQATVTFIGGTVFSSDQYSFFVTSKI